MKVITFLDLKAAFDMEKISITENNKRNGNSKKINLNSEKYIQHSLREGNATLEYVENL